MCTLKINQFMLSNECPSNQLTGQHLVVECVDNGFTLVSRLHPGEADTATEAVGFTQNSGGDDGAVVLEHVLQVLLGEVHGQVGNVQVGGVLLLLLQHTQCPLFLITTVSPSCI